MSSSSPPEIRKAIEALWQAHGKIPSNLYAASEFIYLREVCQTCYPCAGSRDDFNSALSQSVHALGFRSAADDRSQLAIPADIAADRIDAAFHQTRSHCIHLCPLDLADTIHPRRFGPNEVRDFTAGELDNLVSPKDLRRRWPERHFDSQRLSQFSWLVVEEVIDLPCEAGKRVLPNLFTELDWDAGRIKPHKPRFPLAVEAGLFALLTAPWEDVTGFSALDWRPFRIPWVYTLNDDLFARGRTPPDADSLTWEPDFHHDLDGEVIEFERPSRLPLNDDAVEKTDFLTDSAWQELMMARASPLFVGPLPHFFVRAFVSNGIDEFLAHITVVEAALGTPDDHNARSRPKQSGSNKNPGATARVAARLSALLKDPGVGKRYEALFAERSNFLHGRAMIDIPSTSRLEARRLARQCVCGLIGAAISETAPRNREEFLRNLLQQSWSSA